MNKKREKRINFGTKHLCNYILSPTFIYEKTKLPTKIFVLSDTRVNTCARLRTSKCACDPAACFSEHRDLGVMRSSEEYKHTVRAPTNSQARIPARLPTKSHAHTLASVWTSLTKWYKRHLKTYGLSKSWRGSNKTLFDPSLCLNPHKPKLLTNCVQGAKAM